MDKFSCYNKIKVHPEYQEKTTFTRPWETFMYAKMPFGLMNAGEMFQREMHITFAKGNENFVVVYMDDITIYLKFDRDHIKQF